MLKKIGNYFVNFAKKNRFVSIIASVTFVAIVTSMLLFFTEWRQFITTMPLFVSLIIMMLQSEANRYAFLLGSLNSLLYAAVDYSFGLPSSALSALIVSFPIQMVTFIRWNKRKYKNSTIFTKLSWPMRGVCLLGGVAAVLILNVALAKTGSKYLLVDNIANVIGYFNYFFTLFSFIEYPFLQIVGGVISLVNYFRIAFDGDVAIIPRIIYCVYSIICVTKATVSVYKLYLEQHKQTSLDNKK